MALRFYHGDPPAPELVGAIALGPESNPGLLTRAELCEVGTCTIVIDDPLGTEDIQAQKRLYVQEDLEDPSDLRVWYGYVNERTIGREGAGVIYTDAVGRSWSAQLDDVNAVLSFRIFPKSASGSGTASPNRGTESVGDRITWLLSTSEMSAVHDNGLGYVDYPTTPIMDACDYRGQYARDVLLDCAKAVEYNTYAYYDEANANLGLWFNTPDSPLYVSPISISNVSADLDTVFPPYFDATLTRTPSRVFSGIDYTGGANGSAAAPNIYLQRAATITEFYNRDTSVSEPNVKSLAEATRRTYQILNTISKEDDRIKVSVELPSTKINDIKAGQRLFVQFSHLGNFEHGNDYSAGRWTRVLSRSVRDIENRTQVSRILDLELTPLKDICDIPSVAQTGHHSSGGAAVEGHWTSTPGVDCSVLIAAVTNRNHGGPDKAGIGVSGHGGTAIPGTDWDWIATAGYQSTWPQAPFDDFGLDVLARVSEASEPEYFAITAFDGSDRPQMAYAEIQGVTSWDTPVVKEHQAWDASPTSGNVVCSGPGVIFWALAMHEMDWYSGEYIHFAADITQIFAGWAHPNDGNFAPYFAAGYKVIDAAGTYDLTASMYAGTSGPSGIYWASVAVFLAT